MANITDVKLPDNSQYDLKDNVSGYASKVLSATTDDLASLTATGDLADSGKKLSDLVLKSDVKDVLNSTSTTDPLSANQGRLVADNLAANENVYGAKNLNSLPYYESAKSENGITITSDDKGIVTASGTASAVVALYMHSDTIPTNKLVLPKGDYTLLGCPVGGSQDTYCLRVNFGGTQYYDVGSGVNFTLAADTQIEIAVIIKSGTALPVGGITFYPMICDARIIDPTFAPYAPTNHELMSFKANGKVGAKNLLDDDDCFSIDNMDKSGHTFTSNNTDTRNYFDFNIDVWDGTTYIQTLVSKTVASAGHYEYSVSIPNNANRIRFVHNGSQRNIGVMFNTSVTGTCIISLDVTGVDPTTVGGLSFGNIMIRIVEDTDPNYQPFAMTNKQLTDTVKTLDKIKYYESSGASITVPLQVGTLMFVSRASDAVKGIFMVDVTGNINELITASFCTATISGDTITIANTAGVAFNVTVIYSL